MKRGGGSYSGYGRSTNFLQNCPNRYCSYCGLLIVGQATQKIKICPHAGCQMPVAARSGWGPLSGMGRCDECDSLIHRTMFFCQVCKWRNEVALVAREESRKRKREEEEKELKDAKEEIANMSKRIKEFEDEKAAAADQAIEKAMLNIDTTALRKSSNIVTGDPSTTPIAEMSSEAMLNIDTTALGKSSNIVTGDPSTTPIAEMSSDPGTPTIGSHSSAEA